MENKEELQELSMDYILSEFHDQPQEGDEAVDLGEELNQLLEELPTVENLQAAAQQVAQEAEEAEKALEARLAAAADPTVSTDDTCHVICGSLIVTCQQADSKTGFLHVLYSLCAVVFDLVCNAHKTDAILVNGDIDKCAALL